MTTFRALSRRTGAALIFAWLTAASASAASSNDTPEATPAATKCAVPNVDVKLQKRVVPIYPDAAREAGAKGTTTVKVTVDADGKVLYAAVYRSSGNFDLDKEAVRAARASSYAPELSDCKPVAGSYLFVADFMQM